MAAMGNLTSDQKIDFLRSLLANFNSKNDTEKLAILLMVPKVISTCEVSENKLRELYEEIGFTFLNRLLRSKQAPDDCSEHSFRMVSLSILKCFSSIPSMAENAEMLNNVPVFTEILSDALIEECSNKEEVETMVSDCLEIILNIAESPNGCKCLLHNETLAVLGNYARELFYGWQKVFDILKLLMKSPSFTQSSWRRMLPSILTSVVQQVFSDPPKNEVFEFLKHLEDILDICNEDILLIVNFDEVWPPIINGLFGMLRSRLNVIVRNSALSVACKLVLLLGIERFLESKELKDFYFLVFHLSSVELRVSLDVVPDQKDVEKLCLYASCCNVVEKSIQHCCKHEQQERLRSLIFELIGSVLQFFEKFSIGKIERLDVTPYTVMLLKLMCAYMSIQEFALDEDILFHLPSFINIITALYEVDVEREASQCRSDQCSCPHRSCKDTLQQLTLAVVRTTPNISTHNHTDDLAQQTSDELFRDDFRMLSLFLPGLESLTHLKEAREVLLEKNTLGMLLDYFVVVCHREVTKDDMEDPIHENSIESMNQLCDVFCNFVYPEEEICDDACFQVVCSSLLHILINKEYTFLHEDKNLDLLLNLLTICVILLQKTSASSDILEKCMDQFVKVLASTICKTEIKGCRCDSKELLMTELAACSKKIPKFKELLKH